jgi:flagellum-specific peptidoglycan hydrolase FlgJ
MYLKPKLLILILCLGIGSALRAQKVTDRFIEKFLPVAKDIKAELGIPIAIILGVSILESGSGTSINARQLNNYFGMRGRNAIRHRHTTYKQFASAQDSFESFGRLMTTKKFYKKLKDNMDYHKWLTAMNAANYAGAKGVWITRVGGVIKRYNLSLYDK